MRQHLPIILVLLVVCAWARQQYRQSHYEAAPTPAASTPAVDANRPPASTREVVAGPCDAASTLIKRQREAAEDPDEPPTDRPASKAAPIARNEAEPAAVEGHAKAVDDLASIRWVRTSEAQASPKLDWYHVTRSQTCLPCRIAEHDLRKRSVIAASRVLDCVLVDLDTLQDERLPAWLAYYGVTQVPTDLLVHATQRENSFKAEGITLAGDFLDFFDDGREFLEGPSLLRTERTSLLMVARWVEPPHISLSRREPTPAVVTLRQHLPALKGEFVPAGAVPAAVERSIVVRRNRVK